MIHVLLAIVTAVGSPAPSPSPVPEGLKTIITVKTSPFCSAFANHANGAINAAVKNDATLSALVGSLRSSALGDNGVTRSNEEQRLANLADSIYHEYKNGMSEVERLRELAKTANSEEEKAAVKASADALGGALARQHKIQRDLDGFVAFLDTADMRSIGPDDARNNESEGPDFGRFTAEQRGQVTVWVPAGFSGELVDPPKFPGDETPEDDVRLSTLASQDFERRIPDIIRDEMTAADRLNLAGGGC